MGTKRKRSRKGVLAYVEELGWTVKRQGHKIVLVKDGEAIEYTNVTDVFNDLIYL